MNTHFKAGDEVRHMTTGAYRIVDYPEPDGRYFRTVSGSRHATANYARVTAGLCVGDLMRPLNGGPTVQVCAYDAPSEKFFDGEHWRLPDAYERVDKRPEAI
jgi:hypothetical protein